MPARGRSCGTCDHWHDYEPSSSSDKNPHNGACRREFPTTGVCNSDYWCGQWAPLVGGEVVICDTGRVSLEQLHEMIANPGNWIRMSDYLELKPSSDRQAE